MKDFIDRKNNEKLYVQLSDIFVKNIENDDWPVGSQIPTEEDLCKTYKVSRATVRNALIRLVRQGLLIRKPGVGTFVSKKITGNTLLMFTNLKEVVLEPIEDFSTKVVAQTIIMPFDDIGKRLEVSDDKHIIYLKRLRSIEDKPFLIQESYIPFHICPKLLEESLENISLFEILEKKYDIRITSIKNYFDITFLTIEEGKIFEYPKGSPAILLIQQFYSMGVPIIYTRSVNRPNRFKFFIELEKKL